MLNPSQNYSNRPISCNHCICSVYFWLKTQARNGSACQREVNKSLEVSYLIPLSIYVYVLARLASLSTLDLIALITATSGTLVAAKVKWDLGKCHTWTGYCLNSSKLNTYGIYAYIRHPIYTGIFIFVLGGLITVIPDSPWYLSLVVILSLVYILSFLAILGRKETKILAKEIGPEFKHYTKQVHPFLPLRKYSAK